MEDTATSNPAGTSDREGAAMDIQGIVSTTSPGNEAFNPGKQPRQELNMSKTKNSNKEKGDKGNRVLQVPGIETVLSPEDKAMHCFKMAHEFFMEFKTAVNISSLNTAIFLLECVAFIWTPAHKEFWTCAGYLAKASLIRFQYTMDATDVQAVLMLRVGASGDPFPNFFPLRVKENYADQSPEDMMQTAMIILSEFLQAYNPATLEDAICLYQEALKSVPETYFQRWKILRELSDALLIQFHLTGNLTQVNEAVSCLRQAQQTKPNSSTGLSAALATDLGGPIDEGVALQVEVLQNDQKALALIQHGQDLQERFEMDHDLVNLKSAVRTWQEAESLLSWGHECRASLLNDLAVVLQLHFKFCGDPNDVDEAIALLQEALEIRAAPHPGRGGCLNNLAKAVKARFELRGDIKDLDKAIELHREALEIEPELYPDRSIPLDGLATALQTCFEQRGDPKHLDEAIKLHREALEICGTSHCDRGGFINNLSKAVMIQFKQRGNPEDLNRAIELHREALDICAAPHPAWGISLNNLGDAVLTRFEQQGDPNDIKEAIELHRKALETHAAPHSNRSSSLNNLANALCMRFKQQGQPKDIDEAIELHRKALEIHATSHPNRSMSLTNLASAVMLRFQQQEDQKDLDEAIAIEREALEIRAAPHPHRSQSLNNLAIVLYAQFQQKGDPKDINEAIELHREAVEIRAAPHPKRTSSLNNLANALLMRFEQEGDPKDIDESIELHREALKICANSHPFRSACLNNLANAMQARFEQQHDPKDLDEAIELNIESLGICATPHPKRGLSLFNFAAILYTSYLYQPNQMNLDRAISAVQEASTYVSSPPITRLSASRKWVTIATQHSHSSCLAAYHTTIKLLPQLIAFHLDLKSRQQISTRAELTSLASASASCAISLNQNNVAVEFLEASRSVFWAQALHLRTPLDRLANADPTLASKLQNLSQQLEQASFRDISRNALMDTQRQLMSIEAISAQCRQMNEEWDKTLNAIRKLVGFEDFLQPKSIASLRQAAISGPVVILLAKDSTCSALIVKSTGDVQHVQLPALNVQMVGHYADLPHALSGRNFNVISFLKAHGHGEDSTDQSNLKARLYGGREGHVNISANEIYCRFLADVWNTIVKPVFEVLHLKKSDNPSHLWWCPTGTFAFIPIHAAGIYDPDKTDCVSDYVISSYTPTLATLLDPPVHTADLFKMTAVIEPNAPDCSALPGTVVELDKIKSRVPSSQWLTSLESTTQDTVMSHLHSSSVVHFACHGTQNLENPLDSGLILSDGCLKVSQIMRTPENNDPGKMKNMMRLAFLSACETGKGDAKTPDEAMHLAATLLFSGFRGVIATMWTMNDYDGPKIADKFYEYIFKDSNPNTVPPTLPDLTKAAEALHFAVVTLRKEPGMTFQRWVPFVHYGL